MNFNLTKVHTTHKSGSVIQNKIFNFIAKQQGGKHYEGLYINASAQTERKIYFVEYENNSRYTLNPSKNSTSVCRIIDDKTWRINKEKDYLNIIIARHPLSALISQYYSFGWTHPRSNNQHGDQRIKRLTLNEYISEIMKDKSRLVANGMAHTDFIKETEKFMSLVKQPPNANLIILTYEIMITDFSLFCSTICEKLQLDSKTLFHEFKHEFQEQKDLSSEITNSKLITHKRTTNIYEYKDKIDPTLLKSIYSSHPIINEYEIFEKTKKPITKYI